MTPVGGGLVFVPSYFGLVAGAGVLFFLTYFYYIHFKLSCLYNCI